MENVAALASSGVTGSKQLRDAYPGIVKAGAARNGFEMIGTERGRDLAIKGRFPPGPLGHKRHAPGKIGTCFEVTVDLSQLIKTNPVPKSEKKNRI